MNPENRPAIGKIVEYWATKEARDRCPEISAILDIGEPACFACGYWSARWDKYKNWRDRWQHSNLEKAHIIPKAIGGANAPSNFVLLCPKCHEEVPNTNNPNDMFLWISKREGWLLTEINKLKKELRNFGINLDRLNEKEIQALQNIIEDALKNPEAIKAISVHKTKITPSTMAAFIANLYNQSRKHLSP